MAVKPVQLLAILVMAALVAAVIEGASYLAGRELERRGVFYSPGEVVDFAEYLSTRDPVLGWPSPASFGTQDRDETGSRVIPAFDDTREACVSLYGNSFTWGGEVDNTQAWSNVLSQLMSCRVSNFGVGGYGSDQAYLRFLGNTGDGAPDVVLGHLSENILRNLAQLRDLLYPGSFGLKPRFLLREDGQLAQLPLPTYTEEEYREVVARPEDHLEHDWFVPGGPAGIQRLRFPFSLSVLGAFRNFHVQAKLRGRPWYADFYAADHPAGGLDLTAAILVAFRDEALRRGRRPLILLIPTGLDLSHFAEHGEWVYQPLLDRLEETGARPLNAGAGIMAELGARDPCELFTHCSQHFNAEGYALLARVVHEELRRRRR